MASWQLALVASAQTWRHFHVVVGHRLTHRHRGEFTESLHGEGIVTPKAGERFINYRGALLLMYQFTYGLLRKPMQLSVAGAALLSMKIISLVNALFWTSMTVLAIPTALFSITSLYIYTKVLKWLKLMPGHRNCFAAVLYRFFFGTWPSMSFFSRTESSRCHDCQHMPQLWPTGDILSTVDDSSAPQIKSEFRIDDDIKGDLCYFNNTDTDTDIGKLDEEKIDSSRGNNRNSNSRSNAFDFISLETLQASQPTPPHTRSKFVHLPGQGGKIRYLHYTNNTIRGEGKDVPATIVLVPSLFLPCDVLAPLCAFLSQTHDVLTFDFLGIGYSDAPKKRYDIVFHVEQLTAVLQHAGLMKGTQSAVNNRANSSKKSSVVLAGYSYGCAAASLFYALHHSPPQQRQKNRISVKELVMMNPTECYQSFDFLGFPKAMGGWGVKVRDGQVCGALSEFVCMCVHVFACRCEWPVAL